MSARTCPVPPAVAALPVCPKRKLPIPFSAFVNDDGTGDFTLTDPERVEECHRYGLCGVCGHPNGYYLAFLGGPRSATPGRGGYTDPPMHEECAEAAISLCPYIAHPRVPRRSAEISLRNAEVEADEPRGFIDERPESREWVMVIARGSRVRREPTNGGRTALVFQPTRHIRERRFRYNDAGRLEEVTPGA